MSFTDEDWAEIYSERGAEIERSKGQLAVLAGEIGAIAGARLLNFLVSDLK